MATFFRPPEQGKPLSRAELDRLVNTSRTFTDKQGREVLSIDDMLFSVDELLRSGFSGQPWTDGNVYYKFAANVSDENKKLFIEACAEWSGVAALTFIERTDNPPNLIVVQWSEKETSSYVGMLSKPQSIKIMDKHWTNKFNIAHEVGHALGLDHEHTRFDRDKYVHIHWENIPKDKEDNFCIRPTTSYGAYDFASIMHYSKTGSSKNKNKPTISALPPYEDQEKYMGNRKYLSPLDREGMACRYGRSARRPR